MASIETILTRWLNATPKVIMVCLIILVVADLLFSKKLGFLHDAPGYLAGKAFWLRLLAAAAIGGLIFFDQKIILWVQSIREPLISLWVGVGAHLGRWVWLYVSLSYWLSRLFKKAELARVFSTGLLAALFSAITAHALKFLIARARPYEELGPLSWFNYAQGLQDKRGFQSFPSGDVAIVAAVAFFFFYVTPSKIWRWVWLVFPLATAFSRMTLNKHWPTDTMMSWVIANAMAWLFYKLQYAEPRNSQPKLKLS